jgi:hypothetical protein
MVLLRADREVALDLRRLNDRVATERRGPGAWKS